MSRYTRTNNFPAGQKARGAEVKAELDAVQQWSSDMPDSDEVWSGNVNYAAAGGTANAITFSAPNTWTAYTGKDGYKLSIRIAADNTGAATLDVDGLGAKAVVRNDGTALQANDLKQNGIFEFSYNESQEKFYVTAFNGIAVAAAASATAAAASASAAATSATNAASSATAASGSASSASTSASTATTQASNASTSATAAASSASAASTSATNAATSASGASTSATSASTSASTATTQASAASTSATAAASSATSASTSATNASNSATSSATSATNSGNSATASAASAAASLASANNSAASAVSSAASAALAAEIVNITEVQTFTNPKANAPYVHMTASASVPAIKVLPSDEFQVRDSDISIYYEGPVPDYSVPDWLAYMLDGSTGERVGLYLNTDGKLLFNLHGDGVVISSTGEYSSVAIASSVGDWVKIAVTIRRESSSAAAEVKYYENGPQLGTTKTATTGAMATLDIEIPDSLYVGGHTTRARETRTARFLMYNRVLSPSEVLDLCINGPSPADMYGSQVNYLSSPNDFADSDWTKVLVSSACTIVTAATTAPDGGDADKIVVGSLDTVYGLIQSKDIGVGNAQFLLGAKAAEWTRVGVRILQFTPAAYWVSATVDLTDGSILSEDGTGTLSVVSLGDDWYGIVASGVSTGGSQQVIIEPHNVALVQATEQGDGTSGIYVWNARLKRTGITLDLNASDAQSNTGQIFDRAHKNHALLPASGATVVPQKREFEIRWTNTWAGTHELQYVGGTNQAIFPTGDVWIESWTYKIAGATIEDVICGDGSDSDRFVAITTGLAAGTGRFTLVNNTTDGTNLKCTIDPDANFTGSIASVIRGYILE